MKKVNINEMFGRFDDYYHPRIVGELNGQLVKLVKLKGDFIWHHHDEEDEMFYVVKGELLIKLRNEDIRLNPGEFIIIPRKTEHKPMADKEVQVMLFEPASTRNTGNVTSEHTVVPLPLEID